MLATFGPSLKHCGFLLCSKSLKFYFPPNSPRSGPSLPFHAHSLLLYGTWVLCNRQGRDYLFNFTHENTEAQKRTRVLGADESITKKEPMDTDGGVAGPGGRGAGKRGGRGRWDWGTPIILSATTKQERAR